MIASQLFWEALFFNYNEILNKIAIILYNI